MPKTIYETIYKDLKQKIEDGVFAYQELLPSENTLIQNYNCSRNTLRRAVSVLVSDGYVQTMQGKGVRNIYQPVDQTAFTIGEIESFKESAERNGSRASTKVILFTEIEINERQSRMTGFPVGAEVYYIQRIHYLDDVPLILNHNYFLKRAVSGLTKEIAEDSIYRYLEQTLHMNIVNSKRIMTVEKMTEIDEKYLNMNVADYNCMAVISSQTYNGDGVMFEYTQSRHRPDHFRFYDNAVRKTIS
ncbi:UTRA domain-containing protein [Brotaphodocola catenula]|uniref:UTRA domain-containing protein n=1 Tax=Brotaphodocola catenula TaxID=2885361 RepID=A0AAE3APN7_9FIRM|nr:UTRA domain-containing protein [Brotaphodocola catenula]MCC2165471.1 UTRA domain-containing protein [Brotaphodocola catenula]